jgi:MFS transporter, putative metabolite:H+ symporter
MDTANGSIVHTQGITRDRRHGSVKDVVCDSVRATMQDSKQGTQDPTPDDNTSWLGGRAAGLAVLVAALGYFVDIYDLILFAMVRVKSLAELGVTGPDAISQGAYLLNMQMMGMLLGGVLWGVLGDRRGRLSVLFGSIIMYSLANIANGMVHSVSQYAICRFIAGIGLAGELGAGITLVSELMPKRSRGWGTTIVAVVGVCGCLVAAVISGAFPQYFSGVYWRHAYYIGGGLGLALLVLRIGVVESGMFRQVQSSGVARGNFFALFANRDRVKRYLSIIAIGMPIWYVIGILVIFSDSLGTALGVTPAPRPPTALFFCYVGLAVGDIAAGVISQLLASRKRTFAGFLASISVAVVLFFTAGATSTNAFYVCCLLLGLGAGYWALFVTTAAELFGTNLRATATTTAPNFVRGAVVPMSLGFEYLRVSQGAIMAALAVGVVCIAIASVAMWGFAETFGRDLDFVE